MKQRITISQKMGFADFAFPEIMSKERFTLNIQHHNEHYCLPALSTFAILYISLLELIND